MLATWALSFYFSCGYKKKILVCVLNNGKNIKRGWVLPMQFEHAWCHMVSKTLFLSQELVFQLYSQTGQKKDTHSNRRAGRVAQW